MKRIRTEIHGHVHALLLDRAEKRNAFDLAMLRELALALTAFEEAPEGRVAVLLAQGDHFTAGLDLAEVGPAVKAGVPLFPEDLVDPLSLGPRRRTKPLLLAAQGWCLTLGVELMLAADVRLVSDDVRLGQIEIRRGIFPFGGATVRLPQVAGWGNAMRWLLTGDVFGAEEALRVGLAQEVVSASGLRARALELAQTIARAAPLGAQATLVSARAAVELGAPVAAEALLPTARALMATEDADEGMRSFVERREAVFRGR